MATDSATTTQLHGRSTELDAETGLEVDAALAGLDALDIPTAQRRPFAARAWAATWPKIGALVLFLLLWQVVVWSGWKPSYVLPGPGKALSEFGSRLGTSHFWDALARTLVRALEGYALAVVIGVVVGVAVSRSTILRTAVGSFITALQTMPSIVWFPLAILLFKLSESAITFVVVLGAAPSVANGVIYGVDYVPPLLVRVGRSMGARGFSLYRYVVAPAALPSVLAGLKQGWAFAWRSLMAGELLVIVPGHPSVGADLQNSRELLDTVGVMASMITIFVIGVIVDATFNTADQRMRVRRGLVAEGTSAVRAARGNRGRGLAGGGIEPGGGVGDGSAPDLPADAGAGGADGGHSGGGG
ncbi:MULTISPECIES: ABC transporter permease [Frankia]|uniref:ABC transporter transmembrane subunit n=1 Tax=Frankia alni (strain DSM 45986 / CECT 9034 / ACN14a) TaxID=326424 RepID=Q0RDR6_FRAAA|nr:MULTISPECIES: ABC transporter permease subunit [Frankia]CAJ64400.1 putative ABC transporter transmembrane subunit [Frankia alni ACN14a]